MLSPTRVLVSMALDPVPYCITLEIDYCGLYPFNTSCVISALLLYSSPVALAGNGQHIRQLMTLIFAFAWSGGYQCPSQSHGSGLKPRFRIIDQHRIFCAVTLSCHLTLTHQRTTAINTGWVPRQ